MPIEVLPEMTLAAPGVIPPTVLLEAALIEIPNALLRASSPETSVPMKLPRTWLLDAPAFEIDAAAGVSGNDVASAGGSPADRVSRRRRSRQVHAITIVGQRVRSRFVGADEIAQDLIARRAARETDSDRRRCPR